MSAKRMLQSLSALAVAFAFTIPLIAQQTPPPTPPPGQPSTGPSTPPRAPTPPPAPRRPDRQLIWVTGRVVMDEGTIPPERISIDRVCGGRARREGYTDSKGFFSISLGNRQEVFQDASLSGGTFVMGGLSDGPMQEEPMGSMGGLTTNELMNCELRASLPGYRSSTVSLAGRRQFDSPDVGTIVLYSPERQKGTVVSVTELQAPGSARRLVRQGRKAIEKSKWSEAQDRYEKALAQHPGYADAWFELGIVYRQQGKPEEARKAYAKAIEADGNFIKPQAQLAEMAAQRGDWEECLRYSQRVLELDSFTIPRIHFLHAVASYNLGRLEAAEKSVRRAQLFTPAHAEPKLALLLGHVLMRKHDYKGAVQGFESYLRHAPNAADSGNVKQQIQALQLMMAAAPPASSKSAAAPRRDEE